MNKILNLKCILDIRLKWATLNYRECNGGEKSNVWGHLATLLPV